jgi:hypothetical protein
MSQADELIAQLAQEVGKHRSEVTIAIHDRLLDANPVDTGWSRANWIASVGEPDLTPKASKGDPATTRIGEGIAEIMQHTDPTEDQHISNQVPYIGVLDDGHSPQAEAGWVERAADEGEKIGQGKVDAHVVRL